MKLLFFLCMVIGAFSQTYRYEVSESGNELIWECDCSPFNELLLTWNGERPEKGRYSFLVSLRQAGVWSDWLYFAEWSNPGQILFRDPAPFVMTEFGKAKPLKGLCDGFRVKVLGSGGTGLSLLRELFVSVSRLSELPKEEPCEGIAVRLEGVPPLSQMLLRHERPWDLSLPTAMSAALGFLIGQVDPLEFAERVCDDDNGFCESWILNSAEAGRRLRGVHVERLAGFGAIYRELLEGRPVVIGMKGYIPGGPRPYYFEHALCVIGFDPVLKKVHCLDPGFPNPRSVFVSYPLDEFIKAWGRRQNIACLFR